MQISWNDLEADLRLQKVVCLLIGGDNHGEVSEDNSLSRDLTAAYAFTYAEIEKTLGETGGTLRLVLCVPRLLSGEVKDAFTANVTRRFAIRQDVDACKDLRELSDALLKALVEAQETVAAEALEREARFSRFEDEAKSFLGGW